MSSRPWSSVGILILVSVTAAAFQLLVARPEAEARRLWLRQWISGGLGVQFILGPALYLSIPEPPGGLATTILAGAVLTAVALLGWVWQVREVRVGQLVSVLMLILLPMLLARQMLQDRGILPLNAGLDANAG